MAKFKAKSLTKPVGLDVGREVFKAINRVEMGLAVIASAFCLTQKLPPLPSTMLGVATTSLLVQNFILRPKLDERVQQVRYTQVQET